MRLNADARGIFLGEFSGEDQIMVITKSGHFRTTNFDLSSHFEDDVQIIEKYREGKIWSAAYFDAEQNYYYLKRFLIEPGAKQTRFIGEHPESRLIRITEVEYPRLELKFGGKNKDRNPEIIEVAEFIGIKSSKAKGKRLSNYEVKVIQELVPEGLEDPKAEVQKPETKKPEAKKPEAKKPEVKKPEAKKPEAKKPEAKKPEAKKPEAKKPEVKKPEVKKPEAKKPEPETKTPKASAPKKTKQDPDEVPLEVVKPKEEKSDAKNDDKKDSAGQFTLEW